ncbi:MAG: hypothetical protein WBE37_27320 [Bryobacteraceae bacterium]
MKQQGKKQLPEGAIEYFARPVIVPHEVSSPALEPLFANHFELLTMGTDIFLDIGIVDPKDMTEMVQKAQENESDHVVKFSVLQRVAMSPATFVLLVNKVNATLQQIRENNAGQKSEKPKISK